MSINPTYQIILGVIAVIIELTAMIAFLKAKLFWKQIRYFVAILLFCFYGLYIFVAVNSAIGFYSMELNQSNVVYKENKKVSKLDEDTYTENKKQIEMYQIQYRKETNRYGNNSKQLEINIQNLQKEQEKLKETLKKESKTLQKVPKNVFKHLKKIYKKPESTLQTYLFSIIVFVIFVGQILTSPNLSDNKANNNKTNNNDSQLSDFQKRLLLFLDGLYKGRNGEGLNGVKVVSEKTGIPEDECKELRDYLAGLKIENDVDINAITVSQGVVSKNYSKKEIVDYITTHNLFLS